MKVLLNTKRRSLILIAAGVIAIIGVSAVGSVIWQKNHSHKSDAVAGRVVDMQGVQSTSDTPAVDKSDSTSDWTKVTTQAAAFAMKAPDGWNITRYPGDYLGSNHVAYAAGTHASVETSSDPYSGHTLSFRASIELLNDAGLGPQWSSPQPGLKETVEDFSIGDLSGKRYKATFTGDLNQTVYEYIFPLENNKRLDVVYTVNANEVDDVSTVELAIKSITIM